MILKSGVKVSVDPDKDNYNTKKSDLAKEVVMPE